MQQHKDKENTLILVVDSYDLVLMNSSQLVVDRFLKFKVKILFSAESFCWPDASLAEYYPTVKMEEKRYLNSGGFIGYAKQIYEMIQNADSEVADNDDDQLYYTRIFLDSKKKEDLGIELDKRSLIFQNLNGALDEVTVKYEDGHSFLFNKKTDTVPLVVHGNGPIKVDFNGLTNYIPDKWNPTEGCVVCQQNIINLDEVKLEDYPTLTMALFIEHPTAFLEDFLININNLSYPKHKIHLFIHNSVERHTKDVSVFTDKLTDNPLYASVTLHGPTDSAINEATARALSIEESIKQGSDYYFCVDSDAQLEHADIIQHLIKLNRSVVAPLLLRPGKLWSNFWGALNGDGYYKRSADYLDIVQLKQTGLWNVPYMNGAYLVQKRHLKTLSAVDLRDTTLDPDIAICKHLRDKNVFMYVHNEIYYGHLVDSEHIEMSRLHPDLYMIFDNKYTWERKYLNSEFGKVLHETPLQEIAQPCPDVYWLPLMSPFFCRDLIEEMENFGQWSGGKHEDIRLNGGYENVPTVDIHTNQIGWERHWLQILKDYIAPLSSKVFAGFYSESRAIMNFVVRYRPGEQDRLRPHSDSSTFSINMALNDPAKDYEGGGTRFLRYNCSVVESRVGWLLIHPGRLTHHHEGLPTTKGTRYIMVSFVDP